MINACDALETHGQLEPFEYDPGDLAPGQVEIDVVAFDWNCPQHITRRYTEDEFRALKS